MADSQPRVNPGMEVPMYELTRDERDEFVDIFGELGVRHSERFRKVSNRYPQ